MNSWQQALHKLMLGGRINAKRVAFKLHMASDYVSDIIRRDRVDPFAVCNEILKQAEPLARLDVREFLAICDPILRLLFDGTGWAPTYHDPALASGLTYPKLCEFTGALCEDLGGAIKALARIEADGEYTQEDDADIAECQHKVGLLMQRLNAMSVELNRRRKVGAA